MSTGARTNAFARDTMIVCDERLFGFLFFVFALASMSGILVACSWTIERSYRVANATSVHEIASADAGRIGVSFVDEDSFLHRLELAVPAGAALDALPLTLTYSAADPTWIRYGRIRHRLYNSDTVPPRLMLEHRVANTLSLAIVGLLVYQATVGRYGALYWLYRRYLYKKRRRD